MPISTGEFDEGVAERDDDSVVEFEEGTVETSDVDIAGETETYYRLADGD